MTEPADEVTTEPSEPSQQAASASVKETPPLTETVSTASAAAAAVARPAPAGDGGDLEDVMKLVDTGKLNAQEIEALRTFVKEYSTLKIKVDRLKGLLGRSAKAQREAKVEAEQAKKHLDVALQDVKRLRSKVDHLSSRKTHSKFLVVTINYQFYSTQTVESIADFAKIKLCSLQWTF
jgi:outer membrane murein-binding lipoprotein Lpp